jgi:hypothetical protein
VGKKKPEMEVTEYRMSIHFGICSGPIDYIKAIYVGEKEAWSGLSYDVQAFDIDKQELFGGVKKEGGVQGKVTFLTGNSTQLFPTGLSAKFDLDPTEMPAYRGMATIFFSESTGAERNGFYWTANSPYLRGVWVKAARASSGLSESIARIYRVDPLVSLTPGVELDAGGTYSGGHALNWDSNGDYAAHIEDDDPIVVWTLATGEARELPAAGDSLVDGGGIHITKHDEIVYRTGGNFGGGLPTFLKFYNASDLSLAQSIALTPYMGAGTEINAGVAMDDIIIEGQAWALAKVRYNSTPPWILLKRVGGTWVVQWFEPGTTETETLSMGREYAYGVPITGGPTNEVVRVAWPIFAEDTVVPVSIGARSILACHYHWDTDEVVIVCTNGDILVYSPDLGTKLRESTGNDVNLGDPNINSKRMTISPGTIVLPQKADASSVIEYLREISVDTLLVNRSITVASTSFVQKTSPFGQVYANRDTGGVFLAAAAAGPLAFWPFISTEDFDSNPAHMIFETQVNQSWGAGIATAGVDVDGYEAAAQVLYDERFGLSMLWSRQTTVEAFVKEIADHIEATVFLHPRTGLMTLKLIRDDYDIGALPAYTPDNSKILNFKRKLYGETINEIVLTWTNPENEQEETVTVQDDANIAIQGTIVSDGRNYYGIRTVDLATRIAYRDLRSAATPLASCDIEMDRSAWDHVPGDVIKITSPEDGISQLVMRVGPIDYGKNGNSSIKAALVEDVFSLAAAEYSTPPGTEWEDPSEEPSPADFAYVFTLPYFLVVNEVDPTVSTDAEYPTVFAGVLAAEDGQDTAEFELWGELTDAGGGSYEASLGTKTIISHGLLAVDLVEEATSVIAGFDERTQGTGPTVGGLLIIGDGEEDEVELAYISAFDISGYTVKRGVLDTIPRAWAAETPVWFVVHDHTYADDEPRSEGELVEYQILTRTSLGLLTPSSAPIASATLTARPHLPSRPANVTVNAIAFAYEVDCVGVDPIPVTWSERNRVTEDSIILAWDAATVTPEAGQTTRITVYDLLDNELTVHDGLTGTNFDVPTSSFSGNSFGYIKVESVRDDLVSLQGKKQRVKVAPVTADTSQFTADTATITADAG